jgi:hypothetical protein
VCVKFNILVIKKGSLYIRWITCCSCGDHIIFRSAFWTINYNYFKIYRRREWSLRLHLAPAYTVLDIIQHLKYWNKWPSTTILRNCDEVRVKFWKQSDPSGNTSAFVMPHLREITAHNTCSTNSGKMKILRVQLCKFASKYI